MIAENTSAYQYPPQWFNPTEYIPILPVDFTSIAAAIDFYCKFHRYTSWHDRSGVFSVSDYSCATAIQFAEMITKDIHIVRSVQNDSTPLRDFTA